ncbi:hypothetical protein ABKA04_003522 [Annulohypoxylon sp. FPYF3050]
MFNFWPFSRVEQSPPGDRISYEDIDVCGPMGPWPPERRRVSIGIPYTRVYGYPSSGGALVLPYCNGVDLDFLGLSRFESCDKSEDREAEDRHCALMRKLGAWSVQSVDDYILEDILGMQNSGSRTLVIAAWPKNGEGVWVLAVDEDEAWGKGVGAVWNAFTMDERCEIVEKLGGEFYQDPADCPHLNL